MLPVFSVILECRMNGRNSSDRPTVRSQSLYLTFSGGQNVLQNGNFCPYFENSRKGPVFKALNES